MSLLLAYRTGRTWRDGLWYVWRHLRLVLRAGDTEPVELLSACTALTWGAWLASPQWATLAGSPTFRQLAAVAPEWLWAAVMLALGLTQALAVGTAAHVARRVSASLALFLWLSLGLTFLLSNLSSPAGALYTLYGSAAGWVSWRLR